MVAALVLPLRPGLPGSPSGAPAQPSREAPSGLPRGRLIELAGGADAARTTTAAQILLESQREGDPVAWVQPRGGELYPPDLAAAGLDLDALLVVHVPPDAGPAGLPKAAELVLRTGAFGALVLDVSHGRVPRGEAWLGRLASLTREHDCRCALLGPSADRSLGPLVSLRLRARRRRVRPGRHRLDAEILKDKSGVRPSLPGPRVWGGPAGMP
jgi:recombination protein RecA